MKDLKRIADAQPIGSKLCKALGLGPNVISISMECISPSTCELTVRSFMTNEQMSALVEILREYRLEPIDGARN